MCSSPSFWLEVLEGADQGRVIPVSGKKISLGRKIPSREKLVDTSQDSRWILFEEPSVSRIHALMEWDDAKQAYSLTHQSRTNATLVNAVTIEKQYLRGGDLVKMGLLVFIYQARGGDDPPRAPQAPASGAMGHDAGVKMVQEPSDRHPVSGQPKELTPSETAAREKASLTEDLPPAAPDEMNALPGLVYELEVINGADQGRKIPIIGKKNMMGRRIPSREKLVNSPHATRWILFDDESVSRIHARLEWDDREKTFVLHHTLGTNETLVNSKPIERAPLRNGDRVKMGRLELIFNVKPAPPPRPETTSTAEEPAPPSVIPAPKPSAPPRAPGPGRPPEPQPLLPVTPPHHCPREPATVSPPIIPADPADRVKIIAAPIILERPGRKKRYDFSAVNRAGEELFGFMDADEEVEVVRELTDRRLTAVNIRVMAVHPPPAKRVEGKPPPRVRAEGEKTRERYGSLVRKLHPVSDKTIFVFSHQLASMRNVGIPIHRGIETIMTSESDGRFREVLRGLMLSFTAGSSAYNAFSRYPEVFSKAYRGIIAIGESSGRLPYILERQARDLEKLFNFKHKVLASLTYPFMILLFSIIAVLFMMLYFVPNFTEIYRESQAKLPLVTTMLIFSVNCLTSAKFWLAATVVTAVSSFVISNYLHTLMGRYNFDSMTLRLPMVGKLLSANALYSILLNMACMLECGLHIRESLVILKDMTANSVISDALDRMVDSIERGESFHDTLKEVWFIPGFVKDLIQAGESSGDLPHMVRKAAYMLEEQINERLETFLTILEPVLLSILACLVGGIMIAIFLPISNIINSFTP